MVRPGAGVVVKRALTLMAVLNMGFGKRVGECLNLYGRTYDKRRSLAI